MIIEWNKEKNELLKQNKDRLGVCFEDAADKIKKREIITIIPNPNYPNQEIYILNIKNYPFACPFIKTKKGIFLKTLYPARKFKKYIKN